jgi:hypothetical protein
MLKIKEKNKKTDTTLRVTWRKNLVRVLVGFRLGVRDTVRDPFLFVWQRLFNRHLDVPWEHTSLIELQTVLKLKVATVCVRTRRSTRSWPILFLLLEWIQPSIDQLCSHVEAEHCRSTTLRASHLSSDQGLKNVLIQTWISDFMHFSWKDPGSRSFISLWRLWLPVVQAIRELLILKFHKRSRIDRCRGNVLWSFWVFKHMVCRGPRKTMCLILRQQSTNRLLVHRLLSQNQHQCWCHMWVVKDLPPRTSKTSRVHKVPNAFEISRFIMTIGSSASGAEVKDGS